MASVENVHSNLEAVDDFRLLTYTKKYTEFYVIMTSIFLLVFTELPFCDSFYGIKIIFS